jgi:cytochrome P450
VRGGCGCFASMREMRGTRSIADLPGPRGLPLIGNLHQMGGPYEALGTIERWCDRYGPIFKFRMGVRVIVVVCDVDEINCILRERPEGYRRVREIETGFAELSFPGVFSVEGETWRRQRRLAVAALNSNHLHGHFHVVRTATERLHRRLRDAARAGQVLDICEELTSYSLDIVATLAFGHDLNTLERHSSELQHHIEVAFKALSFRCFFPIPYWRWVRLPADRAMERSVIELRLAVATFIEQARVRMRERPELFDAPENFLEAMLAAQRQDNSFSDEEIVGNTFTLMIAGEDTTAHTLAWACWLLAQRPDVQARCAREGEELLGDDPLPATSDLVARFRYVEAALRESIRLQSVSSGQVVQPLSDTTICNTRAPAGTRVLLPTRRITRNAGGSEFDPERWLDERTAPDPKVFLSFGAGQRFCPGRNLAFLESKSALAMITRNFEMELDPSAGPVREQFAFTMIPIGLRVRLRERAVTGVATPSAAA